MDTNTHSTTDKDSLELIEFRCPDCGKVFQIAPSNWEKFKAHDIEYLYQCPHCGGFLMPETLPDPETQCGNCCAKLEPEDQYCRVCGTKRGEGVYVPYYKMFNMQDLYGPMNVIRG